MDLQALIQAGSFGVLAWIVWFVFSRGLPSILGTFVETLREQQATFTKTLTDERERFCRSLENMQQVNITSYREQTQMVTEALKENTDAIQQLQLTAAARQREAA